MDAKFQHRWVDVSGIRHGYVPEGHRIGRVAVTGQLGPRIGIRLREDALVVILRYVYDTKVLHTIPLSARLSVLRKLVSGSP